MATLIDFSKQSKATEFSSGDERVPLNSITEELKAELKGKTVARAMSLGLIEPIDLRKKKRVYKSGLGKDDVPVVMIYLKCVEGDILTRVALSKELQTTDGLKKWQENFGSLLFDGGISPANRAWFGLKRPGMGCIEEIDTVIDFM